MSSFLQVENISKSYGDKVLFQNISFNINEGDKIALIAPNGTGKSSLLKILAGLDSSDRGGEIKFMKDIKVAFLDQMTAFNPANTLFDEVYSRLGDTYTTIRQYEDAIASGDEASISRAMAAMDAADGWSAEQRIKQVLSSLKLTNLRQKMGELSGGEAKRAAIALMILQEADFLVMDEPTNHLDVKYQLDVLDIVKGLGSTVLCALHDLNLAAQYCDRIYILEGGRVRHEGSPYDVITEDVIQEIYGVKSSVEVHPKTGLLNVVYYPRHSSGF